MAEELFRKIRQFTKQWERGTHPNAKAMHLWAFKDQPWASPEIWDYLANEKPLAKMKSPEAPATEQEVILDSLQDFVEKKADKNEGRFRFKGGEVEKKPAIDDGLEMPINCNEDLYSSITDYLSAISKQEGVITELKADTNYKLMFLVDASKLSPEDDSSKCLTGNKRELLDRMAKAMGLSENEYLVSSISEEATHSYQEIMLTNCTTVISVGARPTQLLLGRSEKIAKTHGKFFKRRLIFQNDQEFPFVFMPIFSLDILAINKDMKKTTWNDLQKVMKHLSES